MCLRSSAATLHLQVQNEMMLRIVKGTDGQEIAQHIRLQTAKATGALSPLVRTSLLCF